MANREFTELLDRLASSDHYLLEPRSALKLVREASATGKMGELKGLLERRQIRIPVPASVPKHLQNLGLQLNGEESSEKRRVEYVSASEMAAVLEQRSDTVVDLLEKEGVKFPITRADATKLVLLVHGTEGFEEVQSQTKAAGSVGRRCNGYDC